jgi:probable rRNA maturation factor
MPDSEPLVLFRLRRARAGLRRPALEEFARLLRARVAGGREFQCLVTDDRELQRLNRQFLGKDYPTDVLSFPAGKAARPGKPVPRLLGELAISAKRAAEQAREFGHPVEDEIRILMLHGVLHLVGMDHERDRGAMARAESAWRKKLGLPAGLIERAPA